MQEDTNVFHRFSEKQNKSNLDPFLIELDEWSSQKKLSLKTMKTQTLHAFGCTSGDILLCNQTSKCSHHVSYIGIIVDNRPIFQEKVCFITGKTKKRIYVLYSLKSIVSKIVLLTYDNTYINLYLLYGLLVYGCTSKRKLKRFYKMQKKFLQLIYGKMCDYLLHELFEGIKML